MENYKKQKRNVYEPDLKFRSRLRVRKVLTPPQRLS